MTGSDSTPDFSWLKENDEAAEAAPNTEEESEDSQIAAKASDVEETPPIDEEATENSSVDSNVLSETTEDDSQNSSALDDDEKSDSGNDTGENSSVFDDADEEQPDRDSDSNSPTMMMPGRQLQDDASEDLQDEFDDEDDKTIVLDPVDSPAQTEEHFANAPSDEDSENVSEDSENSDETSDKESEVAEDVSEDSESSDETSDKESEVVEDESTLPDTYALVKKIEPSKVEDKPDKRSSGSSDSKEKSDSEKPDAKNSQKTTSEKSNLKFLLLASYASAVTIIALMLMMRGGQSANSENLESLPDVAPEPADELSYIPVNATLPPGHRLNFGEKQRFGNIEVEPLKIVKEPLEFTHYSGNGDLTRPASRPVYKLWIKFTNVSNKQAIAPLDGALLLRWVMKSEKQREYANYYIFADGTKDDADTIETYRHSKTSDWDLQNQQLGRVLEPGESYETYIPSTEELSRKLPENANWRLQFRKGFSPSGNGVTTIIDVVFHREDVESSS